MSSYTLVSSGIAALAGAVILLRDGEVAGADITILEERHQSGGAVDAHGSAEDRYFLSGSHMLEAMYQCTVDVLDDIPSASDPTISVPEEANPAAAEWRWDNEVRLVNLDGSRPDAHAMGFTEHDRIDLLALIGGSERRLGDKRITDCFAAHFFETTFWLEWGALFAFEPWHSAIEFRRYLRRFIDHFSAIEV